MRYQMLQTRFGRYLHFHISPRSYSINILFCVYAKPWRFPTSPRLLRRSRRKSGAPHSFAVVSYIRYRYMDTPFLAAAFQVIVGGVPVFVAGILIGSS